MEPVRFEDAGILPATGDNTAVAVRRLDAGTRVRVGSSVLTVRHTVPEGHRFAVVPVPAGRPLLSWGSPFGSAVRPLEAGDYVVSERMLTVLRERSAPFDLPEANLVDRPLDPVVLDEATFVPGVQVPPVPEPGTFLGYDRGPGLGVGTRNHLVLVGTSSRTGAFVQALGRRLADVGVGVEGLDPVVTVVHTEGGGRRWANNREVVLRALAGYAVHPNVGAMLCIDEPGSRLSNEDLRSFMAAGDYPSTGRPLVHLTRDGGVADDLDRAERVVRSWLPGVVARRTRQPLSGLSVALQCGGSDAFSGITANPLAGAVARELVRHGGSAVLAETDELIGAEAYVLASVKDLDTATRFLAAVERFEEQVRRHGHTAETNVSGGNLWRGLYNITIKSLGAARKRDPAVRLDHVLDYGQRLTSPGYAFMDSPGNDLESIAGQVATGANIVFFTTGNGSVTNFPFVPTIKIVSTSGRYRLLPAEMDVDAGALLTGTSPDGLTADTFARTVAVASGEATAGEAAGHSQVSLWREWQRGPEAATARPGEDVALDTAPDGRPLLLHGRPRDAGLVGLLEQARPPRDVGLVMPTSICSGQVAQQIARRLDAGARQAQDPDVRYAAPVHTEGCGVSSGASERLFARVVLGHLTHPRVRHALLLEHGCEKTHNDYFRNRLTEAGVDPTSFGWASIQLDGGIAAVGEKVEAWFHDRTDGPETPGDGPETRRAVSPGTGPASPAAGRPLTGPVVALHAVGAVPATAAAVLGRLARALVDAGGSALLMEGGTLQEAPEFRDAVGLDPARSASGTTGVAADDGPTLPHGAAPSAPGLHVMAGPGEDVLEVTSALAAAGAGAVLVHVVGATVPGHPFVPVVQVSADPSTARRCRQDLDQVLEADPDPTPALADLLVRAVSGSHRPRADDAGMFGFQVSRGLLGVSM